MESVKKKKRFWLWLIYYAQFHVGKFIIEILCREIYLLDAKWWIETKKIMNIIESNFR